MLYHLAEYLQSHYDIPGLGVLGYLSFRATAVIILSLFIATVTGKRIIRALQRKQIGEQIRDLGLEGQMQKKGTPTMGGLIIIAAVLIPVLLLCNLKNIYIQMMLVSLIWLGFIGFVDDYIKVFKKNKEGLKGRFKVVGQVGLGIIVGVTMCLSDQVVVREKALAPSPGAVSYSTVTDGSPQRVYLHQPEKTTQTTIPFVKNNEFDYKWLVGGDAPDWLTWLIYIAVAILIVTAVSNGANLTDGLDGLAAGVSALIIVVLGVFAYLGGNMIYADYLNIMFIPGNGELMVFAAAMIGALVGFIWYNCYPAQVFMGDTGSLAIGGIIAVMALATRKELLLPLLCGVFLAESVSVMMQVSYFKYTKKRYGEGKRIFLMSPLHHHFQKRNFPESKIVMRFWIVQIALCAMAIATLKVR